jgi:psiF repeat
MKASIAGTTLAAKHFHFHGSNIALHEVRKTLVYVAACVMGAFAVSVHADNSQQDKMTSCNADAKANTLSGDDRKAFMKTCPSAAAGTGSDRQLVDRRRAQSADLGRSGAPGLWARGET